MHRYGINQLIRIQKVVREVLGPENILGNRFSFLRGIGSPSAEELQRFATLMVKKADAKEGEKFYIPEKVYMVSCAAADAVPS